MFGAEGDRIQAMRQAQAQQYAEELRRQIEEKKVKPKTPAQYTTTNTDIYGRGVTRPQPPNNPPPQRFPAQPTQQQTPSFAVPAPRVSPRRYHDAIPDFTQTNVAPLNLSISTYTPDPTPSLPRQTNHIAALDESSFNDTISSLQSFIEQQGTILMQASEISNHINQSSYPTIVNGIQELKERVDRILTADIPQRSKPILAHAEINKEALDGLDTDMENVTDSTKEKLTDITNSFRQFSTKFNDITDNMKTDLISVQTDLGRLTDQYSAAQHQISNLEVRDQNLSEGISRTTVDFETTDENITNDFNEIQQSISSLILTVSNQLANEIQTEADGRVNISNALQSQVEEVNQRIAHELSRLHNVVDEISISFKSATSQLSASVGEAFNQAQDEIDQVVQDINEKLDSLITDSQTTFKVIYSEAIETIRTLKENAERSSRQINEALIVESKTRKRNFDEIMAKYESFSVLIAKEIELQTKRIYELGGAIVDAGTKKFDEYSQPMRTDLVVLKQQTRVIDEAEDKLTQLDFAYQTANSTMYDTIASLTRDMDDLTHKFDETKKSIDDEFAELDRRANAISATDLPISYSNRFEMLKISEEMNQIIESRIQNVEQQIGVLLANVGELTLSTAPKVKVVSAATRAIEQLAEEENNKTLSSIPSDSIESKPDTPEPESESENKPPVQLAEDVVEAANLDKSQDEDSKTDDLTNDEENQKPNTSRTNVTEDYSRVDDEISDTVSDDGKLVEEEEETNEKAPDTGIKVEPSISGYESVKSSSSMDDKDTEFIEKSESYYMRYPDSPSNPVVTNDTEE